MKANAKAKEESVSSPPTLAAMKAIAMIWAAAKLRWPKSSVSYRSA